LIARKSTFAAVLCLVAACGRTGSEKAGSPEADGGGPAASSLGPSAAASGSPAASAAPGADRAAASPGADAATTPEEAADSYDDKDPSALQDFHPALDAHGTWANDPTYGTVWTPSPAEVGADFTPYVSSGHWVYGDDYVWTSDFEWGWAPFHYGRWVEAGPLGWSWIPGREYAPAWVEWRTGDAYVGWSPAPPLFVWRGGVAVTVGFAPPAPRYVFCAHADLFAPAPARIAIMGPRAIEIERQTYVYAAPGGREHFRHGPPLASLHVPPDRVVHATGHEHGCERAQAFAHPSTCVRLGGHPPTRRPSPEPAPPSHDRPGHPQEGPHGESHPETHGPTEHPHPVAPPGHHAPPPHAAPPQQGAPPKRRK
jgi:hypothetical protein